MNNIARLSSIFLAAVCLASAGCHVQKPRVSLSDITLPGADFSKLDACFQLDIYNLNSFDILLEALDYCVLVEGNELCRDSYRNVPLKLQACNNSPLDLNTAIVFAKVFETCKNIKAGQIVPYELVAAGSFKAMNVNTIVEFRHAGHLIFLKLPEWKFKSMAVLKGSNPALELVFEVTNPNPLPIPLVAVRGSINSGDDAIASIDEKVSRELPANSSEELKFTVSVNPSVAARMLVELATKGRKPQFKGNLKLTPPSSLKQLLLGRIMVK